MDLEFIEEKKEYKKEYFIEKFKKEVEEEINRYKNINSENCIISAKIYDANDVVFFYNENDSAIFCVLFDRRLKKQDIINILNSMNITIIHHPDK